MTFDPSWSKVAATTAGPANIHAAPRNPWAVLTPLPVGADVDFTLVVRSEYETFRVRSDDPVVITSTPLGTP